jgi:hypothetical protein
MMGDRDDELVPAVEYARIMRGLIDAAKAVVRLECEQALTGDSHDEDSSGWTYLLQCEGRYVIKAPNGITAFHCEGMEQSMAERIVRLLNIDNICLLP